MKPDPHQCKRSKSDSAFNYETKKEEVDFIFLKEKQILAQKSKVQVYKNIGTTS